MTRCTFVVAQKDPKLKRLEDVLSAFSETILVRSPSAHESPRNDAEDIESQIPQAPSTWSIPGSRIVKAPGCSMCGVTVAHGSAR